VQSDSSTSFLPPIIPTYLKETYHWAYLHPRNVAWLDQEWIVNLILWGNAKRIREAFLAEIPPSSTVLHAAHVYGLFVKKLIEKISPSGQLDLFDIAPIQLARCHQKLMAHSNVNLWLADANNPFPQHQAPTYDVASSFFLLHELPDERKHKVVQRLLQSVNDTGKVIFVDYHLPTRYHPLKPILSNIFNYLEPFAKSLWTHAITDYAGELHSHFLWRKKTLFGGLYQVVVGMRKKGSA